MTDAEMDAAILAVLHRHPNGASTALIAREVGADLLPVTRSLGRIGLRGLAKATWRISDAGMFAARAT